MTERSMNLIDVARQCGDEPVKVFLHLPPCSTNRLRKHGLKSV